MLRLAAPAGFGFEGQVGLGGWKVDGVLRWVLGSFRVSVSCFGYRISGIGQVVSKPLGARRLPRPLSRPLPPAPRTLPCPPA